MTTTTDLIQHTDQIRNFNDKFRKSDPLIREGGRFMMTRGVQSLLAEKSPLLGRRVRNAGDRPAAGVELLTGEASSTWYPEAGPVARAPFKIVKQAPDEIAVDVDPALDRAMHFDEV